MPVQQWDHVQDPLDVDKQKYKKKYKIEAGVPYEPIRETSNEQDSQKTASRADLNSYKSKVLNNIGSQGSIHNHKSSNNKSQRVERMHSFNKFGKFKVQEPETPQSEVSQEDESMPTEDVFGQTEDSDSDVSISILKMQLEMQHQSAADVVKNLVNARKTQKQQNKKIDDSILEQLMQKRTQQQKVSQSQTINTSDDEEEKIQLPVLANQKSQSKEKSHTVTAEKTQDESSMRSQQIRKSKTMSLNVAEQQFSKAQMEQLMKLMELQQTNLQQNREAQIQSRLESTMTSQKRKDKDKNSIHSSEILNDLKKQQKTQQEILAKEKLLEDQLLIIQQKMKALEHREIQQAILEKAAIERERAAFQFGNTQKSEELKKIRSVQKPDTTPERKQQSPKPKRSDSVNQFGFQKKLLDDGNLTSNGSINIQTPSISPDRIARNTQIQLSNVKPDINQDTKSLKSYNTIGDKSVGSMKIGGLARRRHTKMATQINTELKKEFKEMKESPMIRVSPEKIQNDEENNLLIFAEGSEMSSPLKAKKEKQSPKRVPGQNVENNSPPSTKKKLQVKRSMTTKNLSQKILDDNVRQYGNEMEEFMRKQELIQNNLKQIEKLELEIQTTHKQQENQWAKVTEKIRSRSPAKKINGDLHADDTNEDVAHDEIADLAEKAAALISNPVEKMQNQWAAVAIKAGQYKPTQAQINQWAEMAKKAALMVPGVYTSIGTSINKPDAAVSATQQMANILSNTDSGLDNNKDEWFVKKKDVGTYARARDQGTEPMFGEKSTDPKMRDGTTDAWKRDGQIQTSIKSHQLRTQALSGKVQRNQNCLINDQNSVVVQGDENSSIAKGVTAGNQYNLKDARGITQSLESGVGEIAKSERTSSIAPMEEEEDGIVKSVNKTEPREKESDIKKESSAPKSQAKKDPNEIENQIKNAEKIAEKQATMSDQISLKESTVNIPDATAQISPVNRSDIARRDDYQELPIYHDHLLEEVMDEKYQQLSKQQMKSREQHRNESRSTQQMFENQFLARKDRFGGSNKRGANVQIQNQTKYLPQINESSHHDKDSQNPFELPKLQQNAFPYHMTVASPNSEALTTYQQHAQTDGKCSSCLRKRAGLEHFRPHPNKLDYGFQAPRDFVYRAQMPIQDYPMMPQQYVYPLPYAHQQVSPLHNSHFHQRGNSLPPVIKEPSHFSSKKQRDYGLYKTGQFPFHTRNEEHQNSLQSLESNNFQFHQHKQQTLEHQRQQSAPKYTEGPQEYKNRTQQNPLSNFKGQDLEMYYMEKKLKPEVEKEIKKGFFEIRKKQFDSNGVEQPEEEVQVYVSHICLHNFHPIFSKLSVDTVKLMLQYSIVVYLNKGQTLYAPGFNDTFFYVMLFGKTRVMKPRVQGHVNQTLEPIGQEMSIGWTLGEEILFKAIDGKKPARRDTCKAIIDSCVLGIERRNLTQIKKCLFERNMQDEFNKIEIVLRGNHVVKQNWN